MANKTVPASAYQKDFLDTLSSGKEYLGREHQAPLGSTKLNSAPYLPRKPESSESKTTAESASKEYLGREHQAPLGSTTLNSAPNHPQKPKSSESKVTTKNENVSFKSGMYSNAGALEQEKRIINLIQPTLMSIISASILPVRNSITRLVPAHAIDPDVTG